MKKRIIVSILLVFALGPITYYFFPELVHLDLMFADNYGNYEKSEIRQAILFRHIGVFPIMLLSMLVIPYNIIVMRKPYSFLKKLLVFYSLALCWAMAYVLNYNFFVLIYPLVKIIPYLILMPIVFVTALHFLVDKKDTALLWIRDLRAKQRSKALIADETSFLKKHNMLVNKLAYNFIAIFVLLPLPSLIYDYYHIRIAYDFPFDGFDPKHFFTVYRFQYIRWVPALFVLMVWIPYDYILNHFAHTFFQKLVSFVLLYALWLGVNFFLDVTMEYYSPLEIILTTTFHTLVFVPLFNNLRLFGDKELNELQMNT